MLGHDPDRTGASRDELKPPFARKWYRLFPDEGIQSGVQPVIAGGRLFIGTLAGFLHAIDAETGRDLWRFQTGGPILHAAAVHEGMVYFGSADSQVYALNATDGTACWKAKTGSSVWNAPAVYSGNVIVGSRDGILYAFDCITGAKTWSTDLGAPLLNSPAVDVNAGRVYIGTEAMHVYSLRASDGHILWKSDKLPGWSMRGYHPVIAPDGAVMVTTAPVLSYDRFQELLLEMVKEIFGDFASWRLKKEENDRLRAENFKLMENPETYRRQLDFIRRRLTGEPGFQTFFVLDPKTGRQRFVAPVLASESMNGPAAPPLVTSDHRIIVKYQALLRSRYEHYSPFLNVGYLNTTNGDVVPIMDQTRTYGWYDSLLLVHDEQCQLSLSGNILLNTHQDNVNALDLRTLRGCPEPWALNLHEPAKGEALAIRLAAANGQTVSPGNEWLIRGTAVYGGGSVLDVPVAIAGDSFYYLPTHEINSGCALIAYRTAPLKNQESPLKPGRQTIPTRQLTSQEWASVQEMPWDWDTLSTPRLKNILEALPGTVPGTAAAPLTNTARSTVTAIPDTALDEFIWKEHPTTNPDADPSLRRELNRSVKELLSTEWRPLVTPAAKAPEFAYRFFNDTSETLLTLMLARPFLEPDLRAQADASAAALALGPRAHEASHGGNRALYDMPAAKMRIMDENTRDGLARLYPIYLWCKTESGAAFLRTNWSSLRPSLNTPPDKVEDDCGNSRLAGLIAYCRLARQAGDHDALATSLPTTRRAMRERLVYELAYTRGGVIRQIPVDRGVFSRWRHLTPEVSELIRTYALPIQHSLMDTYVDRHRPGWWLAWNIEQLMRNEAPVQLPTAPLEIFTARALVLHEPTVTLKQFLDLPWCKADEFYIQKLALTLAAAK